MTIVGRSSRGREHDTASKEQPDVVLIGAAHRSMKLHAFVQHLWC
jgi:hypothetical protein